MIIRPYLSKDVEKIRELHDKFFRDDFPIDSLKNLISAYTVEDNNEIISFGCNRTIIESIAITNLDLSARKRIVALRMLLDKLLSSARASNYDGIHCFIDKKEIDWIRVLESHNFKETVGKALYHGVDNGKE